MLKRSSALGIAALLLANEVRGALVVWSVGWTFLKAILGLS
jgi:hypothetical protein